MTERFEFPASHVPGFYCVFDNGIQRPGFVTIEPTPRRQYQFWVKEELVLCVDGYNEFVKQLETYIDSQTRSES